MVIQSWKGFRCNDLYVTKKFQNNTASCLIAICQDTDIRVFNLSTYQIIFTFSMPYCTLSSALSKVHGLYLLTNADLPSSVESSTKFDTDLLVWDIMKKKVVTSYRGYVQTNYILRPCFAGQHESIIVTGSEGN